MEGDKAMAGGRQGHESLKEQDLMQRKRARENGRRMGGDVRDERRARAQVEDAGSAWSSTASGGGLSVNVQGDGTRGGNKL